MSGAGQDVDLEGMSTKQLLATGNQIQDKSLMSIANQKRMINESKDIADATGEALETQKNQMKRIGQDADKIDTTLNRGDANIRTLLRRASSDRIIMCFLVLIILAVVGLLVVEIIYPEQEPEIDPDWDPYAEPNPSSEMVL